MSESVTGMAATVAKLASTVSADALWGIFGEAMPYVGVMCLFGFGIYEIRKMIKGAAHGKVHV